jgi:hypothetical protein
MAKAQYNAMLGSVDIGADEQQPVVVATSQSRQNIEARLPVFPISIGISFYRSPVQKAL